MPPLHLHIGRVHVHLHDDWEESEHKRGQPENAGQFASGPVQPTVGAGNERTAAGAKPLPPHIAALKIPPAWTDVRYNDDPKAALLVVGKDVKGREQRLYSATHHAAQAEAKFARIKELDQKFGAIEKENTKLRDSRHRKIAEAADCLALVMTTGIRPGSEGDTGADKKAFGATTLEGRHVVTRGKDVHLKFVGKKGVDIDIPVADPSVAKMLLDRARTAGKDGKLFPQTSENDLLRHAHSLGGGGFKVKDFRTLIGTRTAMNEVGRMPVPNSPTAYKKAVKQVATVVSSKLGNTPTVALVSYISPVVFAAWRMASGA